MMATLARLGAALRRLVRGLTDRLAGGLALSRNERIAWSLLIAAALLMRLWNLDGMVPHHDESIHAHFAHTLLTQGQYRYDPTYHGPLLFYVTAGVFALFGVSDFTARLYPALAGTLLVALPLLLRRRLGPRVAWFGGLLLAISPVLLYYSRFARNEAPVALYTGAALTAFLLVRRRGWRMVPWIGVFAALHAISKETFYVTLPMITVAAVAVGFRRNFWDSLIRAIEWLRRYERPAGTAVFWFVIISITAYTFVFIHPEDALFPVKAIKYWYGQHSIERVGGPWSYHFPRLALYEFMVIVPALAWVIRRRKRLREVELFCLAWGLSSLAMYAYLGEKVPWLTVHQVLPFVPLAAMQLARTFSTHGRWWSRGLAAVGLAGTLWSGVASSYLYPAMTTADEHGELIVYVQTAPEMGVLADKGRAIAATGAAPIAAVSGEATWPLSWQWVGRNIWWATPPKEMRPPLVVCDAKDEATVTEQLGEGYTRRQIPLRAWWVEDQEEVSAVDVVRWFFTRRTWSPIGATDTVVFVRNDMAGVGPAIGTR
jgi:uncharacterized protein (TIGR03663 family)